jgi:polysaccharide chain length determinant protein (PEP-CTERM system associated)
MNEVIQQLMGYLRGMWHRRWLGLAAAWLAAIIGVIVVYRIPDKYEASARVYVDTATLLQPLLAGLSIQPNVDQQVALMSRTLISRPNVEKLVRMADLDLDAKTGQAHDELVDNVMRSIQLGGNTSTNLYVLAYRSTDPTVALKVVRSLLAIFVESSLGEKRQDSRSAVKFLDDQIKRYEDNLQAAENRLKMFKIKNMGITGGTDYFGRIAQLRAQIEDAKLELNAAEQSRDSYRKELSGETPTFLTESTDTQTSERVPELDNRIAAVTVQRDELLRRYTNEHPDVIAAGRLIEQLTEQRKAVLDARHRANDAAGRPTVKSSERNPLFQQLRISLAEAEASVASLRAKLGGYESQLKQLTAQAQLVPQVEAEYTQLNRDYEIQKRTYESLVTRREQGTMGMDVQDAGGAQFRVIDPPRALPEPVAPNRIALLGLVLAASLAAGMAVSLLASQVMPTFHEVRALRTVTNRPTLGTVTLLPSKAFVKKRRRNAYLFMSAVASLFASFAVVFSFALLFGRAA